MSRRKAQTWCCHCGDHWWAKLTKGFVTMVSPQDAELIQGQVWTAQIAGSSLAYASRHTRHPTKRTILLHREIVPDAAQVDHKNHNGLDNRHENLRSANASLNGANRRKLTKASSIFKGVCHHPGASFSKPWMAICARKYVGHFTTEMEAARAYDDVARNLFGSFARTNFAHEK